MKIHTSTDAYEHRIDIAIDDGNSDSDRLTVLLQQYVCKRALQRVGLEQPKEKQNNISR